MRIFRLCAVAAACLAVSSGAAAGSNQKTRPCGTFTVDAVGHQLGGAFCEISFSFAPSMQKCDAAPCVCNRIVYLQVIRARDVDRAEYIQPFEEQAARMITGNAAPQLNGWAVDRSADNRWGYFASLNTDPISFNEAKLTVGTNAPPAQAATMNDRPERWKRRVRFEAVSVPVCIDEGGPCSNRMLGFQKWRFRVRDDKSGTNPTHSVATEWEREAVMLAVEKWNMRATAGVEQFPDLQPLGQE